MKLNSKRLLLQNKTDTQFGFLNIDINGKTLVGTFYANEEDEPEYYSVSTANNNVIDRFIISNMEYQEQQVS